MKGSGEIQHEGPLNNRHGNNEKEYPEFLAAKAGQLFYSFSSDRSLQVDHERQAYQREEDTVHKVLVSSSLRNQIETRTFYVIIIVPNNNQPLPGIPGKESIG